MALAKNLAVVSLSTTAANFYHSTSNPFVKATIIENIAVVLGGALLSLFAYTSNEIVCEAPFASSLFGIALICACIDAVATSLLTTIISKEWVAVLFPNSHALASANARLSQIDLLAATLCPILVSSILELGGYSVVLSLLISQHALGAFVILRQIDRALKLKPHLVIASSEKGGFRKDSGSFNPFCIFMDNVVPLRAKLVTASFVLLYFTVLSSGAVMTAWLNSSHTHQQTIAWFGSACNLVGAFATVAAPPLIRRVGKFHAGVLAQLGQCACCIMASLAFYRSSNNAVFLILVVASRMGVYVFDLAERQILQESVPRLRQTIFLSTERGLRELALFGMMYLSYWHSKPESFGILVNFSTAASILSSFLLAIALCK
jgi:Ferroportin1 (FPN1)